MGSSMITLSSDPSFGKCVVSLRWIVGVSFWMEIEMIIEGLVTKTTGTVNEYFSIFNFGSL